MSDTPISKAAWTAAIEWLNQRDEAPDPHHVKLANLAEDFERERDEARRDLKLEQSRVWAAMLIIQKSDDERDSLRARVAELEKALRGIVHELATVPLGNNIPLDIARNAIAKKETNHG